MVVSVKKTIKILLKYLLTYYKFTLSQLGVVKSVSHTSHYVISARLSVVSIMQTNLYFPVTVVA